MSDLFSCLAHLVRDQIPEPISLDPNCHAIVAEDAEKLTRLEDDASGARRSLSGGLAVFGKLLICEEAASELGTADVQAIGDFIVSIAETLNELSELESAARDALAGIKASAMGGEQ